MKIMKCTEGGGNGVMEYWARRDRGWPGVIDRLILDPLMKPDFVTVMSLDSAGSQDKLLCPHSLS
jgi:hypothetical protein